MWKTGTLARVQQVEARAALGEALARRDWPEVRNQLKIRNGGTSQVLRWRLGGVLQRSMSKLKGGMSRPIARSSK